MSDRLITVAIHTFEYALMLKGILEHEGVNVTIQNVNLENPTVSSGVRVRIHESDLPLALRIIENPDIFCRSTSANTHEIKEILVPIDFSNYSMMACKIAFNLAQSHKATIALLHTYIAPIHSMREQLSETLTFETSRTDDAQAKLESEARSCMNKFSEALVRLIKNGDIPPIKFTQTVSEGIPEEVINEYAKEHNPMMIVMGTRGADTKERDLVGSVTAEVLDTCRYPVLTIPESVAFTSCDLIHRILFFSNFDQADLLALDSLFKLIPATSVEVKLVKIPSKKDAADNASMRGLLEYCTKRYPTRTFSTDTLAPSSIDDDYARITATGKIDLIAVPNKKKNIFARLFNPGIAHRLLFHSDIPMMVIPV